MHFRTGISAALLVLLAASSVGHAQGFVEHFEPPVLERGKTTRIAVIGLQLGKTLGMWTSLPAGAVKAVPVGESSSSRAMLDVTVAADAPVGICGVRLATIDGLANACLLLIDDLPVKSVNAPADAPAKVALPATIWRRFREAVVDRYSIDVTAGQRVSFEAVGNRLGKDVDPLVTIRDARKRIVAEHDNDAGLYFDCRFEHTFAEAGTYTVEIRDARFHGSEHGCYVLRMGKFPAARTSVPTCLPRDLAGKRAEVNLPELGGAMASVEVPSRLVPGLFFGSLKRPGDDGSSWVPFEAVDGKVFVYQPPTGEPRPPTAELHGPEYPLEDATPVKVPGFLSGVLQKPGERHVYRFELARSQRIQIRAEARAFNSPADLELVMLDARGKELRRGGENPQTEQTSLDFNAGNPGVYGLAVRDVNRDGGPAFTYRLEVRTPSRETEAMVQVNAEAEGLTVPRGSYQTLPLAVTRDTPNGSGKISLSLLGAPPGFTLVPDEIEEGLDATVCKLTVPADAPLGLYTVQILARPHLTMTTTRSLAITPCQQAHLAALNPACMFTAGFCTLHAASAFALPPALVRTRPMIDRQIVNVDLIPYGLREDQTRVPPGLTDRFALQITERSPFTFELPEPSAVLSRYQHVEFPMVTTRIAGFSGPITFSAKGGQIAPKEEGRTRVYAEFPQAKADQPRVLGSIHSLILTNLQKHRVDVTAVGVHDGRRISLTRTFELNVQSAYTITTDPPLLKLEPGMSGKLRLLANRLKSFDGEVTVDLSPQTGLNLPEKIVIPRGQAGVDIDVQASADCSPGRRGVNLNATAVVNRYEEEQRGRFEVDVNKPPPPKKK